jgi:hypothetical protein
LSSIHFSGSALFHWPCFWYPVHCVHELFHVLIFIGAPFLLRNTTSKKEVFLVHELMASVDRGVDILKTCCDKIVIGGFSTWAGLALYQAIQTLY